MSSLSKVLSKVHIVEITGFVCHLDFYVKSTLKDLDVLQLAFLPFWGAQVCQFGRFQPSKSAKRHKNQTSKPLLMW